MWLRTADGSDRNLIKRAATGHKFLFYKRAEWSTDFYCVMSREFEVHVGILGVFEMQEV